MPLPSDPLAALRQARRDPDLVLIEGFHALKHALRFGAEILRAAITDPEEVRKLADALAPDIIERLPAGTPVVSPERMQAAGLKAPITGVLAVAHRPAADVPAALADPRPAPVVLLERPRGLGNIGWCVRTAAAADAAGLLTTGIHDPWCPTAVRIGVGLQFALPVARVANAASTDLPRELLNCDRPLVAVAAPCPGRPRRPRSSCCHRSRDGTPRQTGGRRGRARRTPSPGSRADKLAPGTSGYGTVGCGRP